MCAITIRDTTTRIQSPSETGHVNTLTSRKLDVFIPLEIYTFTARGYFQLRKFHRQLLPRRF